MHRLGVFLIDQPVSDITDFLKEEIKGPATFSCTTGKGCKFEEPGMNDLISTFFGDTYITLQCQGGECLHYSQVPGYVVSFVVESIPAPLTPRRLRLNQTTPRSWLSASRALVSSSFWFPQVRFAVRKCLRLVLTYRYSPLVGWSRSPQRLRHHPSTRERVREAHDRPRPRVSPLL